MRQVVLDTETTGIGHESGHKVIEIAGVELINRKRTGQHFHSYLNPEREVDAGAFRVHGLGLPFLKDKPLFKDIVSDFLEFVGGAELIIHNAPFDVGFINAELKQIKWKKTIEDYCPILDTLVLAREKHPGQRNSLDALCKRYDVDNTNRQLHGALLDAEILIQVYLAMTGGQGTLFGEGHANAEQSVHVLQDVVALRLVSPVVIAANPEECEAHQKMIELLKKKSGVNHWD
jgi:DNA polymerase III subunit epsilon